MGVLIFSVEGKAEPQGSAKAFVMGKRAIVTTDNPKLKPWRRMVAEAAQVAMVEQGFETLPADAAVRVSLEFGMLRGSTVKREFPTTRPDIDKLARGILDALTAAAVFADDAQVVRLEVDQFYADIPGVGVAVSVVPAGSSRGRMKGSI